MYALHALWRADGRLALWAEDARAHPAEPAPAGPDGPVRAGRAHPYACPASAVAGLLTGIGPGLGWLADQAPERWATLRLPTFGGLPTPSPELPVPPSRGGSSLTPWRVPALLFDPAAAAQLLGELFDPRWAVTTAELPGAGRVEVTHGASLRWLTGVHDLAWRLVHRGRTRPLPTVEGGEPYARWHPALDEDGRREATELAAGCPPVCRGEWPGPAAGRGGADLVAELLEVMVDAEARAVLADGPPLLRTGPRAPGGSAGPGAGTAAERWLAALTTTDGRIEPRRSDRTGGGDGSGGSDSGTADAGPGPDEPAEFAALAQRLAAWYAGPAPTDAPLRLCFRLLEPSGPDPDDPEGRPSDDHWQLEFLLQAADEPSLLVPAADLRFGSAALAAFARRTDDPLDAYSAELDRAALHWPVLREARRALHPTALPLDRAGALDFLRTAAPELTAAGFGVLLPTWWRHRPTLGFALEVRTPAAGIVESTGQIDRDAVVAFRWQAALGDLTLSQEELAELAEAKQGLVRIRGRWIEADAGQIAAALAFLTRHQEGAMPTAQVLRTALDPGASIVGLPVTAVHADGPLGDLLAGRAVARAPGAVLPEDFRATLRPYQERGMAWLRSLAGLGLGAVLADDMGLGKTVQTLALLAVERAEGVTGPTLLVCPMSLVGNWQREAERFAPALGLYVHHGAGRPTGDELRAAVRGADLVITTYGLVQRDARALAAVRWRRIVADEAQSIKNSATAQARAIRSLPVSTQRIALTGTPVENRLAELHAVLDFANPGLFGSAAGFKELYAIPVEQHGSAAVAAELQRLTAPFVLRRLKSDPAIAVELPAKQEMTVWCNLTTEQAGLYQAVVAELLHRVEGIRGVERRGTVLAAIGRLKQVCNHPAQLLHDDSALADRSGKVARLVEILAAAAAEGDRTLVFTQYAEFGRLLQPYLAERLGQEVLHLHGGVPKRRREELVARFQTPDGPGVFLLSLRAGGSGLNLTAANQVIHLDRWWNPAVEEQATDRAFRIGQRRDVQVRRLVCVGTVEERIAEMIESKRALAEAVVGAGEHWLTELPADELRALVALSADAVGEE
ncbi:DEAD/DEAH box helicase [Kitasatospora sp. NBC_00240]|uniref:DEAD/DEAH box helicase n=1 Tax=Kitasatospora sp. NBC_00240 TaxID=2903567 RepID=UPI002253950F|nr:DEAD/DEAH box helicase [Kitasatospora sp. NBC_00240]MCX5212129.1 DEAD/DEAH box helicase [Kitasatospora sp. NBC_00240]